VTEQHGGNKLLTRVRLRPAATFFQKALWFGLAFALVFAAGVCDWCALAVAPLLLALLVHVRYSHRRLNGVVMASVLSVAEQLGMTVVGQPDAFQRPLELQPDDHQALPLAGAAARQATAFAVSPILARAAGLLPAPRPVPVRC